LSPPTAGGFSKGGTMAEGNEHVRAISDSPFCWQSKVALRRIREAFDAEKSVASALGVYFALTEIASDMQAESFQTTHAYIAQKSGLSPRTVQDRLAGLAEIGLVEIKTPALKAPSTYRLLPVEQPLQNDTQPLLNVQQRAKKAPLLTSEESKEKSMKESKYVSNDDVLADASASDLLLEKYQQKVMLAEVEASLGSDYEKPFHIPTSEEVMEFATQHDLNFDAVDKFLFDREQDGWQIKKLDGTVEPVFDWQKFITAFSEKYDRDRTGLS
jgi:hypothetical protein